MNSKRIKPKINLDSDSTPQPDSPDLDENEFVDEMPDSEAILRLSDFFAQETEALENIKQIFEQYLSWNEFAPHKAKLLRDSLSIYLGQENAELLLSLIISTLEDDPKNLFLKIQDIEPKIEKVIRLLASLYGNALEKSYMAQDENPNGWRSLSPRINYELFSGQWFIQLTVEKYNGEVTVFEENPLSLVQLMSSILSIMKQIPAKDAHYTVSTEEIEDLEDLFEDFIRLFKRNVKPEST